MAPLDLERIKKKAISESVAEQLRMAILSGEVAVGERLPPERELAPRFGTNRNTLREAIRSLEAQGLVIARQGDGVRVTNFRNTGELSLLPDLLRVADREERDRMIEDVLLMRRRMAVDVARLAARRASPESVELLEAVMKKQEGHDGDLLLTLHTDLEVYQAMVDAADSVTGSLLFVTLNRLARACLELVPALLFVHPDYVGSMTRVVEAIANHDPDAAGDALDDLLRRTDEVLMKRLGDFP
ncbi:MAG: GntR family transcriptional regulator [Myxococcota bacterium]|nr:GntR family transcriptional regulator [Myxococcota bacterium]